VLNLNHNLLRTGTSLPKALQNELDALHAAYTTGLCDDPVESARSAFHLFHPGPSFSGTVTVLFHGTGNDALFTWEFLILELLRTGRAVLTFDLPGHGRSSSTFLNEESFARAGAFLPALLRKLVPTLEETEALGYSLGALAALQQVKDGSLPWQSLVMMAVPERVTITPAFLAREAISFGCKPWRQQLARFGWDASFPAFGPVRRARFPIRLDPDIRMTYPAFVAEVFKNKNMKEELKSLSVPILLLYGEQDSLAKAEYGRRLAASHRQVTFELVPGANHFLLPLVHQTRDALIAWLTSRQRPAAN
jgi:pimeloyl-ACP methyl ester carboxylesterase